MVAWAGCLPMPLLRHHLARFSAKLFAINSSPIPPQHKPPSGAKSGLALEIILYALILRYLFKRWLGAKGNVKGVLGRVIAVCVIFFFAKSNVYIFSDQLNFVF